MMRAPLPTLQMGKVVSRPKQHSQVVTLPYPGALCAITTTVNHDQASLFSIDAQRILQDSQNST